MICPICGEIGYTYTMIGERMNENCMAIQCRCQCLSTFMTQTEAICIFRPGDGTYLHWNGTELSEGQDKVWVKSVVAPKDVERTLERFIAVAYIMDVMRG